MVNVDDFFEYKEKLGIKIPTLEKDWDDYTFEEQIAIINEWERERAKIPDQIKKLEQKIDDIQDLMFELEFEEYLTIHKDIVQMASSINDLNILFRTHGEVTKG